ncbi:MAG: hypothetical protein ACMG6H_08945 [Acidobacteriota bacterium]
MSVNGTEAEINPRGGDWKRWVLRGLAMLIGVIAVVDFVIILIPMPSPQQPSFGAGQRLMYRSSETETSIIRAKNWAESNINPVGWLARSRGFGPDRLYILKRNENWKNALEIGQVLTIFFLFILSLTIWIVSARAGLRKLWVRLQ